MVGSIETIKKYFELTEIQSNQLIRLTEAVFEKNKVLNLISRKDAHNIWEHHILHSLAIGKLVELPANSSILDVGTGGGFPGLPLAILFPECRFTLLDATLKKIKAIHEFIEVAEIENVTAVHTRIEDYKIQHDFIVSRAVTRLEVFTNWVRKNIKPGSINNMHKSIFYLRGPDVDFNSIHEEIHEDFDCNRIENLSKYFSEDYFSTKNLVFLQRI